MWGKPRFRFPPGGTDAPAAHYHRPMRTRLVANLDSLLGAPHDPSARPVTPADAPALAGLMLAAYRGTIDDAGEGPKEARAEVDRLFDGAYGPFDWAASELSIRGMNVVSAALITFSHGMPFLAFSLTTPCEQRRGLARAGLLRAMHRLAIEGHRCLHLAVTPGNVPAESLYASLRFRHEPLPY